jgi:hypothetical protein
MGLIVIQVTSSRFVFQISLQPKWQDWQIGVYYSGMIFNAVESIVW